MVIGDRYLLTERIAVGGMGEVWRAEDTALGRPVAVKLLKAEYAGSVEFRTRLRREAQHAAALAHPGIAQMYDHGEEPPYIIMELVEGEPLSEERARHGVLSPHRTATIVAQTAAALAAAHAAGIVHRDVKPDNLLITADGTVKVTDFGIASAADGVALTQAGHLVGTPRYISPEQASGHAATAASDLYALGVIAYECLTGRPPFEGGGMAVAVAHRDSPPPPLPSGVPLDLRALVSALLAKDPAARPPGATAVAERAAAIARTAPRTAVTPDAGSGPPEPDSGTLVQPRPPARPVRRKVPLLAAAGATLLLLIGLAWGLRGNGSSPNTPAAPPISETGRPWPTPSAGLDHRSPRPTPRTRTTSRTSGQRRATATTQQQQPQTPGRKKGRGHGRHG